MGVGGMRLRVGGVGWGVERVRLGVGRVGSKVSVWGRSLGVGRLG